MFVKKSTFIEPNERCQTQIKGCYWSQNAKPLEMKGIKMILNIIEAAHKVTSS